MKGRFDTNTFKDRTKSRDGYEKRTRPANASRPETSARQGGGSRPESGFRQGTSMRPGAESAPGQGDWKKPDRPFNQGRKVKPVTVDESGAAAPAESHEDFDKIEGRNSVLEALKSGRSINKIFISKGDKEGSINQIIALGKEKGVVIQEVDRNRLDIMSTSHAHQGVIAFVAAKDYVEVDDILGIAEASGTAPFIIILDEITDAYNLGSILRTANAVGAHGVIIPKRRAVGLTATVSKASAGAIEYVPVARVTNISQTIDYLKKKNIWVVGTDSTGQQPYYKNDLKGPIALVIGSEGEGIGKLVRESCDFIVNIPMMGQISSLNAAVAGAIVMYEILKQRSSLT